ncbi:MAG: amidohydrolase [Clostridia bacterium]|jgi:hypothetical protein|nr:amidohydrolase [Clostridia bacterium]MDD4571393.1 amidohydrolase [Clostridia bacterium]
MFSAGTEAYIKADHVLYSNAVFSPERSALFAGGIAVKDNYILQAGTKEEIACYIDDNTKITELGDKLLMPGFHDCHVHFMMGGLHINNVDLSDCKSAEECAKKTYDFYLAHPGNYKEGEWVLGFSWYNFFWEDQNFPKKEQLDKYFPDMPVFLLNADAHAAWTNSKGLEIVGITKDTENPPFGTIHKDENGEPTGYIDEGAMVLFTKYAYSFGLETQIKLIADMMGDFAKNGVTSCNDMLPFFGVNLGSLEGLERLEEQGKLTMRVNFANDLYDDFAFTKELRKKYKGGKINHFGLKQFADGIIVTHTTNLVEPYNDEPETPPMMVCDLGLLEEAFIKADSLDIPVHLHAVGDGSIRCILDIAAKARALNGTKDIRHSIEHLDLTHPDDFKRLAELGIVASMQPPHMALTDTYEECPYPFVVGKDRERYLWAMKSMLNHNVHLALGTDHPVVTINPFIGIYRAVTRLYNDGKPEGGWNPQEKLTMWETLASYTLGSAYMAHRDHELGSLEAGKLADIIAVDRNLFTLEPRAIMDAEVVLTMVDGKIVYQK